MAISCEQCREHLGELLEAASPASEGATAASGAAPLSTAATAMDAVAGGGSSRAAIEAHLSGCANCTSDLALLRRARAELRALPALPAPGDLRSRIRAQIQESPAKQSAPAAAAPRRGILEELAGFFRRPARVAWASGAVLATFVLLIAVRSQPVRQMSGVPDSTALSPAPTASIESRRDNRESDAAAKSRSAKSQSSKSRATGAARRGQAPDAGPGRPAAPSKPAGGEKPPPPDPAVNTAAGSTGIAGSSELMPAREPAADGGNGGESTRDRLFEYRSSSPPSPSPARAPNPAERFAAPSSGPAAIRSGARPEGSDALRKSAPALRSKAKQSPAGAAAVPPLSPSSQGAMADNRRDVLTGARLQPSRLARLQFLPGEEQSRGEMRRQTHASAATAPQVAQSMSDEDKSSPAGSRARASAASRPTDAGARAGALESNPRLEAAPPRSPAPSAAFSLPRETAASRQGSRSADAVQDANEVRGNRATGAAEERAQRPDSPVPGAGGGFGGGLFGGGAADRMDAPRAPAAVVAPPRQTISPGILHRTGTAAYLTGGLRAGETRSARLIVTPPRDVAVAQVAVELSSGLRLSHPASGGGGDGARTVWRGAARRNQPIEVLLSLTGVTVGVQSVRVTLRDATREYGATTVDSETLPVNVLAR